MFYIKADTNSYVSFSIFNRFETTLDAVDFMGIYIKKNFDGWGLEVNEDKLVWRLCSPHKTGVVKDIYVEFTVLECEKEEER